MGGLETAGPGCYDAVAIARAAGFRVLVMSPHPSCGDCPLTARSRAKRGVKISRKTVAGQQYLSGVETLAELPFIGDQVVCLSHQYDGSYARLGSQDTSPRGRSPIRRDRRGGYCTASL